MKKYRLLMSAVVLFALLLTDSCGTSADKGMDSPSEIVYLYPEGQGTDKGITEDGIKVTEGPLESSMNPNSESVDSARVYRDTGDEARMEIYIPEHCNGQMVVNCPGGGYMATCCQSEGDFAAEWFTSRGIAVCTLIYRIPCGHPDIPLRDVQNAFRYCRYHASDWGVKQIGVIGYSAGGHLAASASTLFCDDVTRPDFSILIYPWISNVDHISESILSSRRSFAGDDAEKYEYYSLERRVSPQTPPTAIFLSSDDLIVPPQHSIDYYNALRDNGVEASLHIYPKGFHGWGFNTLETAGYDMLGEYRKDFLCSLETFLDAVRRY